MPSVPLSEFSLRVSAADDDALDPHTVDELALDLRAALADAGVSRIEQLPGAAAPDGTRSVELLAACTFLITSVQTAEALAKIVQEIRKWLARRGENRQKVRVSVAGVDLDLAAGTDVGPIVATLLAAPGRATAGVRRALIVANAHYDDPALAQLRAPSHDADALALVLGNPSIGGFDVDLLTDADERTIRRRIAALFAGRDRDDVVLLHFSCHGVKDTRGRLHLAARDTDMSALGATSIPAGFINDQMAQTQSKRVVLILDCCYSGAFARDSVARAATTVHLGDEFATGSGRIVLTASSATEYAFEEADLTRSEGHPSVFTTALVAGLTTGEADLDTDGEISIDELYDYTYRQVRMLTPDQTPMKWSFGVEGSLAIARSVRPAALPAVILEDLASDRTILRSAAVTALTQLIRTGRPGQREAAYAALIRLRDHDDSSQIRAAASEALAAGAGIAEMPPAPAAAPRAEASFLDAALQAEPAAPMSLAPAPPAAAPPVAADDAFGSLSVSPSVDQRPASARTGPEGGLQRPPTAKRAMIFGVISIVTAACLVGVVPAIVALVLAGRAAKLIREEPTVYTGRTLVAWARILAWTALAVIGILTIVSLSTAG